jgi:predicted aldo/keto reductase-like oxidoreductase
MAKQSNLGGTFTFPNTSMTVKRMGYGAMQLAGREGKKMVWGPPPNVPGAVAVLREAIASGVDHIDTSYGRHVYQGATHNGGESQRFKVTGCAFVVGHSQQALG